MFAIIQKYCGRSRNSGIGLCDHTEILWHFQKFWKIGDCRQTEFLYHSRNSGIGVCDHSKTFTSIQKITCYRVTVNNVAVIYCVNFDYHFLSALRADAWLASSSRKAIDATKMIALPSQLIYHSKTLKKRMLATHSTICNGVPIFKKSVYL